jgi:predicted SnoaL-like aldol condensation-catalyzing enzyme
MFDELMNHRQTERAAEYFADDVVDHNLGPGQAPGRAGLEDQMRRALAANPALRVNVEDVVVQDDRVAVRETWHTASGVWNIAHFFRFANGRIVEEWSMGWPAPPEDARTQSL